jgi:DnaJ-class molecular chaperone
MNDLFSQMFRGRQGGMGGGFRQQAFKGEDRRYSMGIGFLDAALGGSQELRLADGSTLSVKIPRGIDDGKTIRLKGKGDPGMNGGPAGDAMITVKVKPHPVFKRDGLDVEVLVPVTVYEAGLGAKVDVPTLRGGVGLRIPAGSSSGKVLRLKGRGIETARAKGDQLVRISIEMPKTVDAGMKAALEDLKENHPYDPREKMNKAMG